MIEQLFYIFPPEIIMKKFPDLKIDDQDMMIAESSFDTYYQTWVSGIRYGWNPDMKGYCGLAYHFETTDHKDCCKLLEDPLFLWDKRLGTVINVDTELKKNCWFLNKFSKTIDMRYPLMINDDSYRRRTIEGYQISAVRSSGTIGGLVGIVRREKQKHENNIFIKRGSWIGQKHMD